MHEVPDLSPPEAFGLGAGERRVRVGRMSMWDGVNKAEYSRKGRGKHQEAKVDDRDGAGA